MFSTLVAAALGAFFANIIAELIKAQSRASALVESNRDSDLAAILRSLDEMQSLGEKYWSQGSAALADDEPMLRGKIVARQQYVSSLVASLFTGPRKHECDVEFMSVIDSLSGGDFGPGCPSELERLQSIYEATLRFSHLVVHQRRGLPRGWLA
jgi:hypothetical protein